MISLDHFSLKVEIGVGIAYNGFDSPEASPIKKPFYNEGFFAVSYPVVDLPGLEPGSSGDSPEEVAND